LTHKFTAVVIFSSFEFPSPTNRFVKRPFVHLLKCCSTLSAGNCGISGRGDDQPITGVTPLILKCCPIEHLNDNPRLTVVTPLILKCCSIFSEVGFIYHSVVTPLILKCCSI
jgi:hypothetical protein